MFKNFFSKPHYESDAKLFLKELHQKNPELSKKQIEGRFLLWEKSNCYPTVRKAPSFRSEI